MSEQIEATSPESPDSEATTIWASHKCANDRADGLYTLCQERLARIHWLEEKQRELEEARRKANEAVSRLQTEREQIEATLRQHENHVQHGYATHDLVERVRFALRQQQDIAAGAIDNCRQFRDDLIVQLRALVLCAEMTGNAATHAEKAARLRGLVELIEGGVAKLREMSFNHPHQRFWPDPFASDYPTRHFLSRIHELEAEVVQLKAEAKGKNEQPEEAGKDECPL